MQYMFDEALWPLLCNYSFPGPATRYYMYLAWGEDNWNDVRISVLAGISVNG